MAPPNNPNIARVTYQMHRGTRVVENTFHLYKSLGWSEAQLIAALEAAYGLWNTYVKPALTSAIALYNIHGAVYDPTGSPWVADRPVTPELPGTVGGAFEPGNCTVTVSERANLAGRAYRGRIYWPGIATSQYSGDDTANSTLLTALANFAVAWLATYPAGGATGQLAIFHRNDNLFTPVRSIVLENVLDSMRRRLPGRGI